MPMTPPGEVTGMPADLAAVERDDALLNWINSLRPDAEIPDEAPIATGLARILSASRHRVLTDSNRELVNAETALTIMRESHRIRRLRDRQATMLRITGVTLGFAVLGLLAHYAAPSVPSHVLHELRDLLSGVAR